jgi:hypothetical protein
MVNLLICLAAYGKTVDNFTIQIRPFQNAPVPDPAEWTVSVSSAVFESKLWILSLRFL